MHDNNLAKQYKLWLWYAPIHTLRRIIEFETVRCHQDILWPPLSLNGLSHIVEVCRPFDNSDICLILSCEFHFAGRWFLQSCLYHLHLHTYFLLCGENGSVPWTWLRNARSSTGGGLVCSSGIGRRTFNKIVTPTEGGSWKSLLASGKKARCPNSSLRYAVAGSICTVNGKYTPYCITIMAISYGEMDIKLCP